MSSAPPFRGQPKMPYPFKYALVFAGASEGEGGTVEAFFVSKTLGDKCCNELNATIGQGKPMFATCKIFPDKDD